MWKKLIKVVRPALEDLVSRTVKSIDFATSLPGAPDFEYFVIQFFASFTNKKSAIEIVTPMKDPDCQWRVSGYYIKYMRLRSIHKMFEDYQNIFVNVINFNIWFTGRKLPV